VPCHSNRKWNWKDGCIIFYFILHG
jgi:hypothetical protein